MYLWLTNKKLKIKNLPINPAKGGIPDIDKNAKTEVIDTKLYLLKTFKELIVFIFFVSNKNNKQKNRYKRYIYIYIFIYMIENPKKGLLENKLSVFWKNKCITWIEVYSKFGNQTFPEI
jgi:hypothetical protein